MTSSSGKNKADHASLEEKTRSLVAYGISEFKGSSTKPRISIMSTSQRKLTADLPCKRAEDDNATNPQSSLSILPTQEQLDVNDTLSEVNIAVGHMSERTPAAATVSPILTSSFVMMQARQPSRVPHIIIPSDSEEEQPRKATPNKSHFTNRLTKRKRSTRCLSAAERGWNALRSVFSIPPSDFGDGDAPSPKRPRHDSVASSGIDENFAQLKRSGWKENGQKKWTEISGNSAVTSRGSFHSKAKSKGQTPVTSTTHRAEDSTQVSHSATEANVSNRPDHQRPKTSTSATAATNGGVFASSSSKDAPVASSAFKIVVQSTQQAGPRKGLNRSNRPDWRQSTVQATEANPGNEYLLPLLSEGQPSISNPAPKPSANSIKPIPLVNPPTGPSNPGRPQSAKKGAYQTKFHRRPLTAAAQNINKWPPRSVQEVINHSLNHAKNTTNPKQVIFDPNFWEGNPPHYPRLGHVMEADENGNWKPRPGFRLSTPIQQPLRNQIGQPIRPSCANALRNGVNTARHQANGGGGNGPGGTGGNRPRLKNKRTVDRFKGNGSRRSNRSARRPWTGRRRSPPRL